MKKIFFGLLASVLALSVCACAGCKDGIYTVEQNGVEYMVDTEKHTIFDGTYIYQYEFSGDRTQYRIDITYPDGSTYWWNGGSSATASFGGWSEDRDDLYGYADGGVLREILLEKAPQGAADSAQIFVAVFIIALGAVWTFFPRAVWYLGYGWRFKNAEPSDAALMFGRMGGVIAAAFGFFVLFL